jgi:bacterial/archaeal transporter family-2 protein
MAGILYSLLAGIVIALQGVMNTRVSEQAGPWLTNTIVHGSGFVVSLLLYAWVREGSIGQLQHVGKGYLFGGALGVVIVYAVMKGIGELGAGTAVAILLVSQLLFALAIDSFGLFGSPRIPVSWNKAAGIGIMIAGIAVFKWK